jgi:WD40 repeat protein
LGDCLGAILSWWQDLPEGARITGLAFAGAATLLLVVRGIARRWRRTSTDTKKASIEHSPTEGSSSILQAASPVVSPVPTDQVDVALDTDAHLVRTTKAFRLFVSSTFRDFGQERELLQAKVFPEIDAYCAAKGYQFYPLDLRWGVNEEAQRDQRTAEICLGEVDAAKGYPPPNFLILIGDRYGWVPLPYAIARDEFEALVRWLNDNGQQKAARDLGTVYQHDKNYLIEPGLSGADPDVRISAYTVRSRVNESELKDAAPWQQLEAHLLGTLQTAADALLHSGRISASGREKYSASLTEQEINHGLIGGGHSVIMSPSTPGARGAQAIALIREIGDHTSVSPEILSRFMEADADRKRRLGSLKGRIRAELPDASLIEARATLTANGELDQAYLQRIAEQITAKLKAAVDKHIASTERLEQAPNFALESERAEHRVFREEKRKVFVGREGNLAAIERYLEGSADHALITYGPSGAGKSALMAEAIARAEKLGGHPIYRFVGASAASSDFRSLFVSLVEELAHRGIAAKLDAFEDDDNKFAVQISTLLESLPRGTVIFLDALDQISSYRPACLPTKLTSGAKIVVSVLSDAAYKEDSAIYERLQSRLPRGAFLEIGSLRRSDGREILAKLEGREHCLRDDQRDYILHQFEVGGTPLWLRTAFEIAKSWKSTDRPGEGHQALVADTTALISQFIDGLTDVHHHERQLVVRTLGYLAAAKDGLSAKELTEVLADDGDVMKAISSEYAHAKSLPPSVWVRLNRQLAPFLIEKRVDDQPLMHFFHRQVRQVAHDRYYEGDAKTGLHAALADYFDPQNSRRQGRTDYDKRSLSELPAQLHGAQRRSRLDHILTAPDWMQQKLNAFGPQILVADYDQYTTSDMHRLIGRTLRLTVGICARDPRQLLPQLLGRLMGCRPPAVDPFLEEVRRKLSAPAMVTKLPSLAAPGAEITRFEGHTHSVRALAMLRNGWLASGSSDCTIRLWDLRTSTEIAKLEGHTNSVNELVMLPDGRLASCSEDRTIRLWEPETGAEISRLKGHRRGVEALVLLPDGRLATSALDDPILLWDLASGAVTTRLGKDQTRAAGVLVVLPDGRLAAGYGDGTIRIWDLNTGAEAAQLKDGDGTNLITALAVMPGNLLASGQSTNGTIRLWNLSTGTEAGRLEGHTDKGVYALAVLPDGRLASGFGDKTIRVWDAEAGLETAQLDGHTNAIRALVVLPDGRLASCAYGDDSTIRVWDPNTSTNNTGLERHADTVMAVALLPDGRLASGCADHTIRLWDGETGAEGGRLQGHTSYVSALAVLPDGRLASGSGYGDNTIRLWNTKSGVETGQLEGHTNAVRTLAILPDGRLASGSDDGTIRLWHIKTGAETLRLRAQADALAVISNGRLASASRDIIRLWNIKTGAEIARLEGHTQPVTALAVLKDGRLASGSYDRTIRLWNLKSGAEAGRLEGHTDSVRALAVLSDGRLASASDDRTVRLWDADLREGTGSTGKQIVRLEVDAGVRCLAARPDGCLVVGDVLGRLHWLEIVE